ncbi:hypothetical protein [Marinobacter xestospongiae]|uniref:phage tail tube protein n=1 Tax=Marinobacter xestospongiae TaxID=994319 RepID=UPI002004EE82|nr:hypothetical protein [Marinobacter xestospongiae]MCK7566712.1 hypothetical protein [Marinobacter xestospongiae]
MSYQDKGLIFAGNIYIANVENGVVGDFIGPINTTRFELTPPKPEAKTRISRERDSYGQALDTVNLPGEAPRVAIDFDSLASSTLADALAGKAEDYEAAVQSVSAEPITLAEGVWQKLPYPHVDETSVTVTKDSDSTVLTLGTDFELEPVTGLIRALNSEAAEAVTVDFDTLASKGQRYLGATDLTKRRQILMDGKNLVTNKPAYVTVYEAAFSANQAVNLLSQEFITGTLEGNMVTPTGKNAPFEVVIEE